MLEGDIENLSVNGHLIKKYFCWSPSRDYPVHTWCGVLGLWNLSANLFDLFALGILSYLFVALFAYFWVWLIYQTSSWLLLSSYVIGLQIMHKDITISKNVILFYVLNSEQVLIFLDVTRNS